MSPSFLWGWDGTQWVKVLVNAEGKLIIDPSEILENDPSVNEHGKAPDSDWAYDEAVIRATADLLRLLLAGGTMSGAIAMGANKITGLAAGTVAGDAVRYEQLGAFTELAGGQNKQPTVTATWEDYDLSAIIGAGAKAVLVMMANAGTSAAYTAGARKNGSALARYGVLVQSGSVSTRWDVALVTECDANRIIEIYSGDKTYIYFNILGYWS